MLYIHTFAMCHIKHFAQNLCDIVTAPWASNIAACACAGNAGNVLPATNFKGNRLLTIPVCITTRASRTCRDACRVRKPAVAWKTFPAFPAHAQPAILTYLERGPWFTKPELYKAWSVTRKQHLRVGCDSGWIMEIGLWSTRKKTDIMIHRASRVLCAIAWMFLPLDIPSEYRPEHVTFGLLCVIFKFPSGIFCRRVPGFATDCPCGVWCRGLTTCLLYVGPPLEF